MLGPPHLSVNSIFVEWSSITYMPVLRFAVHGFVFTKMKIALDCLVRALTIAFIFKFYVFFCRSIFIFFPFPLHKMRREVGERERERDSKPNKKKYPQQKGEALRQCEKKE